MTAPLSALVAAWEAAREQWINEAQKPDAGNYDTPECLFWASEMERFQGLIEACPITSQIDAAAMVRFIWVEADAANDAWPQVRRSALAKIKEWAVAA